MRFISFRETMPKKSIGFGKKKKKRYENKRFSPFPNSPIPLLNAIGENYIFTTSVWTPATLLVVRTDLIWGRKRVKIIVLPTKAD